MNRGIVYKFIFYNATVLKTYEKNAQGHRCVFIRRKNKCTAADISTELLLIQFMNQCKAGLVDFEVMIFKTIFCIKGDRYAGANREGYLPYHFYDSR